MPDSRAAETLVIARRFCGPPKSGNGGYVCGRLAAHVPGAAVVRLKAPPPLETELRIESSGAGVKLLDGTAEIGEARAADAGWTLPIPAAPTYAQAQEAAKSCIGFKRHAFPRCFVCGPQRAAGDGLCIFPGELPGGDMVAAPWVPDASLADAAGKVSDEFLWAALDCSSGFAVMPIPEGKAILLGELCASIRAEIAPGEECVVIGWRLQIDGRKRIAGSAVFSASGAPVAAGRATWIEVSASAFGGL
jgi:hypothetical protein